MTEGYTQSYAPPNGAQGFPGAQGPFMPQPAPPEPDDFSGDEVWHFTYNFGKYSKGKEVKGEVPVPSQARIDAYERDFARVGVEHDYANTQVQRAIEQAEAAKAKAAEAGEGERDLTVEEAMQYVEVAQKGKTEALNKLRDCLADFCAGHPTRKQFDLLPENAIVAFNNAIRRKLNPNS